jgi:hypothetical protein
MTQEIKMKFFVSFFRKKAPFNSIIPEVNGVDFFKMFDVVWP